MRSKDATERADFKSNTQKTRLNFLTAYMSITYKCRIKCEILP